MGGQAVKRVTTDDNGDPIVKEMPGVEGGSDLDPHPHRPHGAQAQHIDQVRTECQRSGDPVPPVHGAYGGW